MKTFITSLSVLVATANAVFTGFNYGNTFSDGRVKVQADWEKEFKAAASLEGTNGIFKSARLYTNIQGGSATDPISAIPAAIKTDTSLLLGIWTSAGPDVVNKEITALQNAIKQYGDDFTSRVAGLSIGSEDLYRITQTAKDNGEVNPGASPQQIADYIKQVRDALRGTSLEKVPIGHVDTWTAFANATNRAVFEAVDWIGVDAYPYFEKEHGNHISHAARLFQDALDQAAAAGKEIWITETGWPVSGKTIGDAITGPDVAKMYWDDVVCPRIGKVNMWYYTYQDANPTTPNPSFGVVGGNDGQKTLFDLRCNKKVIALPAQPSSASASAINTNDSTYQNTSESSSSATSTASHASSSGASASPTSSSNASASGTGKAGGSGTANTPAATSNSSSDKANTSAAAITTTSTTILAAVIVATAALLL